MNNVLTFNLKKKLRETYPGYIIPPIPQKDYQFKWFNELDKIEYRQRMFKLFLKYILSHEELRYAPILKNFLKEDENVLKQT